MFWFPIMTNKWTKFTCIKQALALSMQFSVIPLDIPLHSPNKGFQPASSSTSTKWQSPKTTTSPPPALKVFQINFQSLREKKLQFFSFVELNKPDIIVGTETWLTKEMFDSEFLPSELGFTVYRRGRIGQKGGGVIILVRSALSSEEKSEFNSDCENLWVQLNLVGSKSVLIGAYYKPHEFDQWPARPRWTE